MKLAKNPSWKSFRKAKPLCCPHCHKEVYLRNNSLEIEYPQPEKNVMKDRRKIPADIVDQLLLINDGQLFK